MLETRRLAEAILTLSKRSWIETSRETAELTESEFLALDYLADTGTATVGEVQKHIKVLPAQMSRLVRRLQEADLVSSEINRQDRRKIDVTITQAGRASHARYRDAKLAPIIAALERLTKMERSQFMMLVERMSGR
jgi:DNA-binding MarR family transcriptional regulator